MNYFYKKKKVYKVVRSHAGRLYSTYAPRSIRRLYKEGMVTCPLFGTKLFCFLSLKEAMDYGKSFPGYRIYEAEATNVEKNGWLDYEIDNITELRMMFRNHMMHKSAYYVSCAVCDSIKLLKRI
jgi:hypothetical protein